MHFNIRALFLIPIVLFAGCTPWSQTPQEPFPSATAEARLEVTREVFPAVVRIDVKQETYEGGKRKLIGGIGSGVIIDDQGHILTNFHVAGRAAEIYVTLFNKERVAGRLVGDDHWTDLAIVQMDMNAIRDKHITFKHATLGNSADLVESQDVMAIGTPWGLARTCTLGIVSNNDRTFGETAELKIDDLYETGVFANWIQIDAAINPGNSGGPLVDMKGRVVGINTRGGGQNLNFAIPIDIAKQVIQQILATATPETKGFVPRSDLGIDLKPLQGFEEFYHTDLNHGALVNAVEKGSPAANAGVKAQDIILELNAQPFNVRFPEELASRRKVIADLPIGSTVTLKIQRGAEIKIFTMVTEKLQSAVTEEKELTTWGLSVREVTRPYANEAHLDDSTGLLVTSLNNDFPAAKADIHAGDIIHKIDGQSVDDLNSFMKLYNASVKQKQTKVLLEIKRGRLTQQAVLEISY